MLLIRFLIVLLVVVATVASVWWTFSLVPLLLTVTFAVNGLSLVWLMSHLPTVLCAYALAVLIPMTLAYSLLRGLWWLCGWPWEEESSCSSYY